MAGPDLVKGSKAGLFGRHDERLRFGIVLAFESSRFCVPMVMPGELKVGGA